MRYLWKIILYQLKKVIGIDIDNTITDLVEYMIEEAAKEKIKTYFEEACRKKDKNFGNGRFARKYFEQVKMNQAGRIIRDDINDKISIMNIKEEDIGDI